MDEKIIQIIPAGNWCAEYEGGSVSPLLCIALVERTDEDGDKSTFVSGVDGDVCGQLELCYDASNFVRYVRRDAQTE